MSVSESKEYLQSMLLWSPSKFSKALSNLISFYLLFYHCPEYQTVLSVVSCEMQLPKVEPGLAAVIGEVCCD